MKSVILRIALAPMGILLFIPVVAVLALYALGDMTLLAATALKELYEERKARKLC